MRSRTDVAARRTRVDRRGDRPALAGLATAGLLVLLTACGSTVQQQGPDAIGTAPGGVTIDPLTGEAVAPEVDPLGSPGEDGSNPAAGGAGQGGPPASEGPASGSAGVDGESAPRDAGSGAAGAPADARRPGNVPGVTDTIVKLGVEHLSTEELAAFSDAAGVQAVGKTDQLQAYEAVVAEVNRRGGVAGGRRLVIVPRKRSISESNSQAAQRSCAAFTEDDRVLVANGYFVQDSPMVPCLADRGVLSVAAGYVEAGSQRDFQRFSGRYMAPAVVDTITAARGYVVALVRQGFLTPKSTVGLLWFDFADVVAARQSGLLPALKRHGITLKSEYRATYKGDPAELGQIASQMQNASLRFRADGVDRVLTLDYNGTLQFFFMQNAENQGYRPKYGLASWSDAEFLRANSSKEQLAGSTGIGWLPAYDVDQQHQPLDPAKQRCLAIMKTAKMPPIAAQTDRILQYQACSMVLHVAAVLNTATELTPAGLAAAAASLGDQPSYAGFSDSYARDKLWGGAAYRDLAYDTSCSCFTYRGSNRSF